MGALNSVNCERRASVLPCLGVGIVPLGCRCVVIDRCVSEKTLEEAENACTSDCGTTEETQQTCMMTQESPPRPGLIEVLAEWTSSRLSQVLDSKKQLWFLINDYNMENNSQDPLGSDSHLLMYGITQLSLVQMRFLFSHHQQLYRQSLLDKMFPAKIIPDMSINGTAEAANIDVTPLGLAIALCLPLQVEQWLIDESDINVREPKQGYSPLSIAAVSGNKVVFDILLKDPRLSLFSLLSALRIVTSRINKTQSQPAGTPSIQAWQVDALCEYSSALTETIQFLGHSPVSDFSPGLESALDVVDESLLSPSKLSANNLQALTIETLLKDGGVVQEGKSARKKSGSGLLRRVGKAVSSSFKKQQFPSASSDQGSVKASLTDTSDVSSQTSQTSSSTVTITAGGRSYKFGSHSFSGSSSYWAKRSS